MIYIIKLLKTYGVVLLVESVCHMAQCHTTQEKYLEFDYKYIMTGE